jgi:hypothetical protein
VETGESFNVQPLSLEPEVGACEERESDLRYVTSCSDVPTLDASEERRCTRGRAPLYHRPAAPLSDARECATVQYSHSQPRFM